MLPVVLSLVIYVLVLSVVYRVMAVVCRWCRYSTIAWCIVVAVVLSIVVYSNGCRVSVVLSMV